MSPPPRLNFLLKDRLLRPRSWLVLFSRHMWLLVFYLYSVSEEWFNRGAAPAFFHFRCNQFVVLWHELYIGAVKILTPRRMTAVYFWCSRVISEAQAEEETAFWRHIKYPMVRTLIKGGCAPHLACSTICKGIRSCVMKSSLKCKIQSVRYTGKRTKSRSCIWELGNLRFLLSVSLIGFCGWKVSGILRSRAPLPYTAMTGPQDTIW